MRGDNHENNCFLSIIEEQGLKGGQRGKYVDDNRKMRQDKKSGGMNWNRKSGTPSSTQHGTAVKHRFQAVVVKGSVHL